MTEADFRSKHLGVGGAIIISAWISHKDNGAMTVLNLANNQLGKLVLPDGWSEKYNDGPNWGYTHTDGRTQGQHPGKPEGIIALAAAIPGMGALAKLDISSSFIGAEQEENLQRICFARGIYLAK
jgi:hypothetical protein